MWPTYISENYGPTSQIGNYCVRCHNKRPWPYFCVRYVCFSPARLVLFALPFLFFTLLLVHTIQIHKEKKERSDLCNSCQCQQWAQSSCFMIKTEVLINLLSWLRDSWPPGSRIIFFSSLEERKQTHDIPKCWKFRVFFSSNLWLPLTTDIAFIYRATADQRPIQSLWHYSMLGMKKKPLLDV